MLNIFKKSYWSTEKEKLPTVTVSYNMQLLRTHEALHVLREYYAKMPGFKDLKPEEITETFSRRLLNHEDLLTLEKTAKEKRKKLKIGADYEFQPNIYKTDPHEYLSLLSAAVFEIGQSIESDTKNYLKEEFTGVDLSQFNPNLITILEPLSENETDPALDAEQTRLVKKYFQEDIQSKLISQDEAEKLMIRPYIINT
jgi:hypothetical protein